MHAMLNNYQCKSACYATCLDWRSGQGTDIHTKYDVHVQYCIGIVLSSTRLRSLSDKKGDDCKQQGAHGDDVDERAAAGRWFELIWYVWI